MTCVLECQIEELRAELRCVIDPFERHQIKAELDLAQAELAMAVNIPFSPT